MPSDHHRHLTSNNYKANSYPSSSSSSSDGTDEDVLANGLPPAMPNPSFPCDDGIQASPFPTTIPNNLNRRATVSGVPLIPPSLATAAAVRGKKRRLIEGVETLHERSSAPIDDRAQRSVSICEDEMVYDFDNTRRRQSSSASIYYYQRLRRDSQTSSLARTDSRSSWHRFTTESSEIETAAGLKGRSSSTWSQYGQQRRQQQEDEDKEFNALPPPPVSPYYRDSTYWLKIIIVLSICKGLIEAGLRSSYVNEVSAYGQAAIVRGMLMLGIEALICMIYPIIHRWFEINTQAKFLLLIGGLGSSFHIYYLVFGAATAFRGQTIYILACCIAAFLYPLDVVGSYIIIGRSGYFCCRDPTRSSALDGVVNDNDQNDNNSLNDRDGPHGGGQFRSMLSRNMSLFFGTYFFSYVGAGLLNVALGLLFTSRAQNLTDANEYLLLSFWLSGMLSIMGSFLYLALPPCPKSDVIPGTPIPEVSPLKTLLFPIVNRRYSLFALFVFSCGMVEGILYGDVILCLVNPILGGKVGNLIAGFVQIAEGITAFFFGLLLYKTGWRKRYVILLATISIVIGITLFSFAIFTFDINAPAGSFERPNYKPDLDNSGNWLLVETPTLEDYLNVFVIVGIISFGEALYKSQLPVILNTIFQDTKYHMLANANIKGLRCIGYATQLAISISVNPRTLTEHFTNGDNHFLIVPLFTLVLVVIAYIPIAISWSRSCIRNRGLTSSLTSRQS